MVENKLRDLKYHKNFSLYLEVTSDKNLYRFFSSISENYDSIKDKYLYDFRQKIAHMHSEYIKVKSELKTEEEKLNQKNIKIQYSPSELSIINGYSFKDIIFENEVGDTINFTNDDLEFMKYYIEQNKNCNVERIIISKVEIEYNNSKEEMKTLLKQQKKEYRVIDFLRGETIPLDELFKRLHPVHEKHYNKLLEIETRIAEIELLEQKTKFLKKLGYFEIEAILDFYNTYIKYEETYKGFYSLRQKRDNNEVNNDIHDIALTQTMKDLMYNEDTKNHTSYKLYKASRRSEITNYHYLPLFIDSFVFPYSIKKAVDWYQEFHSSKLTDEQQNEFSEKERIENSKLLLKEIRTSRKKDVVEYYF